MKILFVATGLGLGGAERQVVDLATRLLREGHEITIAYMVDELELRPDEARVKLFPLHCKRTPLGMARAYWKLRKLILTWRPDVVHSHMVHANIFTRLVRLSCPMQRLICTAHSTEEGGKIWMLAYRMTNRLADLTTNVSKVAVKAFENKGAAKPKQMLAVYNGIDTKKFTSSIVQRHDMRQAMHIKSKQKLILSVGRLVRAKGFDILLESFSQLQQEDQNLILWIAGEGEERKILQSQLESLGLANCVTLLGARDDVVSLLNAADVFILPSRFEGFGLVVAEAMSCEKVVVATDSGGVREVMGEFGFLVPPEQPEAMKRALKEALALTEEEARKIGKEGRQHIIAQFDLEATLQRWLRLYQGIYS